MDDNFVNDLAAVINRHSKENESNTPDFILDEYLARCLDAFNAAVIRRAQWYGLADTTCVFCEIVAKRAPATIVREWEDAIAIVPLNPVAAGHVLVLPKTHVQTFFSDPDVSAATMRRAAEMLHGVERHHEPRDHNVITSAGRAATQTVFHLHVHIVPRAEGDGLPLPWTPQQEGTNG